jgi:hypothetical protein
MYSLADAEIGAAATDVAIHRRVYILIRGLGSFCKKSRSRHHLAGLAITALWHVEVRPRELHGMRTVERETFHSGDVGIAGSGDWRLARADSATANMHGTRTALADATSIFGAAQVEDVAENPQQWHILRRVDCERFPVYNEFVGHEAIQDNRGLIISASSGERTGQLLSKDKTRAARVSIASVNTKKWALEVKTAESFLFGGGGVSCSDSGERKNR